jgi:hypothetical protein
MLPAFTPVVCRLLSALIAASFGKGAQAQSIQIKLVNGRNGRPLAGTHVNVWVGKERKWAIVIPTDKDGVASLVLTDKEGEVNFHVSLRCDRCGEEFIVFHDLERVDGQPLDAKCFITNL